MKLYKESPHSLSFRGTRNLRCKIDKDWNYIQRNPNIVISTERRLKR